MNGTTALTVQQPARVTDSILISEGKGLIPTNFSGLWEMAQIFSVSGLMPKDYVNKPEAVFVAINMGYELGLSPMAAIQNISVINGRPTVWGDAMLGIARGSGKLSKFAEYFTGTFPNDDFTAVCECSRGQETGKSEFSVSDAKDAGLWKYPSQGITPWHKYPKRMLQMRARSWALRDMFSDVLKGISATEELTDYDVEVTPQHDSTYAAETPRNGKSKPAKANTQVEYQPVQVSVKTNIEQLTELLSNQPEAETAHGYLDEYLTELTTGRNMSTDNIVNMAVKNFDRFMKAFKTWMDAKTPEQEQPAIELPQSLVDLHRDFPEEFNQALLNLGIESVTEADVDAITKRVNELLDEQTADYMTTEMETELL